MTDLPPAREVLRQATGPAAAEVALTYDARLLRRRRLVTEAGEGFLVDLAQTVSLDQGDAFRLEDGRLVAVRAAEEDLLAITAAPADLPRIAWHIGNRHAPAEFDAEGRILIQRDPVLRRMLEGLGAAVTEIRAPFTPEGGAYGHGRTMGHSHAHDHSHHHDHSHDHDH